MWTHTYLRKETKHTKYMKIPEGREKKDIESREKIIKNFYQRWKKANPSQKKYNTNLKDYINIRSISITETAQKAAKYWYSTYAVLQLDYILTYAKKIAEVPTKKDNKNQKMFSKIIKMEYSLYGGKVSLIVGVQKRTDEKIQYCITAIKHKRA